jgi:DNA polymerase V
MQTKETSILEALRDFRARRKQVCPLAGETVPAGFPSPADDFVDRGVDLNEELVQHPSATFFVRVQGESMTGAGIQSGDTLIVDRALRVQDGQIVVARLGDTFTVKRYRRIGGQHYLAPENDTFALIAIGEESDCELWGVVTWVLHRAR